MYINMQRGRAYTVYMLSVQASSMLHRPTQNVRVGDLRKIAKTAAIATANFALASCRCGLFDGCTSIYYLQTSRSITHLQFLTREEHLPASELSELYSSASSS